MPGKNKLEVFPTLLTIVLLLMLSGCGETKHGEVRDVGVEGSSIIRLPSREDYAKIPLNDAIRKQKATREFAGGGISLEALSALLWASSGLKQDSGNGDITGATRNTPSAGAIYPFTIYLVLRGAVFRYSPVGHYLKRIRAHISGSDIARAACDQEAVSDANCVFVLSADFGKTEAKYKERAERYVYMEAGFIAQNVVLEASSLDLGSVVIGAFDDNAVRDILGIAANERPVCLIAVGKRRSSGSSQR
ncbi:MAG: SagB/ThcOx family dehydrogenase [Actinomycetota bacterium]|nr:SagB/ThcOx family dehydrogenase [Actinomycetota bacterium]